MRYGKNKEFIVKGIQITVEYWQKNGHKVLCFLPDYLLNYDEVNKKKKLVAMNVKEVKAS
jgi:hypothetical protein